MLRLLIPAGPLGFLAGAVPTMIKIAGEVLK